MQAACAVFDGDMRGLWINAMVDAGVDALVFDGKDALHLLSRLRLS
jgi:hypothetical protein